jgi:hypothetical protein
VAALETAGGANGLLKKCEQRRVNAPLLCAFY